MIRKFPLHSLVFVLAVAGCARAATIRPFCDGYESPVPFLTVESVSEEQQRVAREAYQYAQMSANAYNRVPKFTLPDSVRELAPIDMGDGLQATLFEVDSSGRLAAVVVAFRGTEGLDQEDWLKGNVGNRQVMHAESLYVATRAKYPEDVRIVVTGHSLGGALALHTSTNFPDVDAYVFNSSYRFAWQGAKHRAHRLSVSDQQDIATPARALLKQIEVRHYGDFRCTWGALAAHAIDRLARCLTHIAAIQDPGAVESLRRTGWHPACTAPRPG